MMMRETTSSLICVLVLGLALNFSRINLTAATKEDVEERFSSIKGLETGEDELALMAAAAAANELDNSDLTPGAFRPDIPTVCRIILAEALQQQQQSQKRNFNPWGGKRSSSDYSQLVKKGSGFNPWGGKRQFMTDHENRIVTKNDSPGKNRLPFNPWGG